MTYDVERLSTCIFATWISFSVKCPFESFAHFLTGLFSYCWALRGLRIFWIQMLYQTWLVCGLSFLSLNRVSCRTEVGESTLNLITLKSLCGVKVEMPSKQGKSPGTGESVGSSRNPKKGVCWAGPTSPVGLGEEFGLHPTEVLIPEMLMSHLWSQAFHVILIELTS